MLRRLYYKFLKMQLQLEVHQLNSNQVTFFQFMTFYMDLCFQVVMMLRLVLQNISDSIYLRWLLDTRITNNNNSKIISSNNRIHRTQETLNLLPRIPTKQDLHNRIIKEGSLQTSLLNISFKK